MAPCIVTYTWPVMTGQMVELVVHLIRGFYPPCVLESMRGAGNLQQEDHVRGLRPDAVKKKGSDGRKEGSETGE